MSTLHVTDVATAIAALTIPGIRLHDLPDMPQAVDTRQCPLLGPSSHEPEFLTDWVSARISFQGNVQNAYTLNYTLFQSPAGKDRGLFVEYPAMVENAQKVISALQAVAKVDGCKSITLAGMPAFGRVFDASGNQFHGAKIAIRVIEF